MSSISGGGGRPPKIDGPQQPVVQNETQSTPAEAKLQATAKGTVDRFEKVRPQIETSLQNITGKALAGKLQFSNEELAQLAAAFAVVLKQYPRADRKERAKLFAKTLLRKKRIAKLLESADEEQVEKLFENIAEQLDGSPVFAQLVDDVTEGARKINLG
jgi:hypothetical protein